jgi:hypothetical protein
MGVTVKPTKIDRMAERAIARHAQPVSEKVAEVVTWGADEHVLIGLAVGWWLLSRPAPATMCCLQQWPPHFFRISSRPCSIRNGRIDARSRAIYAACPSRVRHSMLFHRDVRSMLARSLRPPPNCRRRNATRLGLSEPFSSPHVLCCWRTG